MMKTLRVAVVSDASPRLVWRLAQRIEREVPGVTICGLIHNIRESSAKGRQSADKYLRMGTTRLCDLCLRWLHASSRQPNADALFDRKILLRLSQQAGWPIAFLDTDGYHDAADLLQRQQADFCVALLQEPVAAALLAIPQLGSVIVNRPEQNPICASNGFAAEQEIMITASLVQGFGEPTAIQALSLPVDPYDTPTSIALKTDVVGIDLLIQSAARIVHGNGADMQAPAYSSWILSVLDSRHRRKAEAQPVAPSSPFTRAPWKLLFLSLALWPFVLVRNWSRRLRGRFPVIILVHHLISDIPHRMAMSTEMFFRQVQFLEKHYRVVSLSEAVELLKSGEIHVPTVVLTFDDGYEENFLTLRSVVEATGVPVSIFVCTGVVEHQEEFSHDRAKGQSNFRALSWDQVAYLGNNGMEVGSHTRYHLNCGISDEGTLYEEIVGSKTDLQQRLGKRVRFFGFPFGEPENMSPHAMKLARSHYEYFLSCFGGENFASRANGRSHLLRQALESSTWELELALQGILDLRKRIKRRFGWGGEAQGIERVQTIAALNDIA
jgi:peptidoglycan/xylan/chitin deacetylase (PgdA/CDA1 family)